MEKHQSCPHCPQTEDVLDMDTHLYNSFGGYMVLKDGLHYFSEDPAGDKAFEDNMTLAAIEKEASKQPEYKWEVVLALPLRGATWKRKDGVWHLAETNKGFA